MKTLQFVSLLALYGMLSAPALAQDLTIDSPWARANPPVVPNSAAYMTIQNSSQQPDRLLEVRGEVAGSVELHNHLNENGVMKMRPVEAIDIPADGTAVLAPGGFHVMLIGLKAPLTAGDQFPLTLRFEKAGEMSVQVTVRDATRTTMDHGSHDMNQDGATNHQGHDMKHQGTMKHDDAVQ